MLYIYANDVTPLVEHLGSVAKDLGTPSYYLYKITNSFTGAVNYFMFDDISSNSCGYNLFLFRHSFTSSVSSGINVPLNLPAGEYTYVLYQTPVQSLDLTQAILPPLGTGFLTVQMEDTVNTNINTSVYE